MAQTKDNKVLKQLWKDLDHALSKYTWELYLSFADAVIYKRLTDIYLCDALRIHHFLMEQQCELHGERTMREGMDYWSGPCRKFNCSGIDRQIKQMILLEEETGWSGAPETVFEDLKTAVISMEEYIGAWEAFSTTEEPPF